MKKQNLLIWGLVILIICTVVFSIVFFRVKSVKQKENLDNGQVESGEYVNNNVDKNENNEIGEVYEVNIDINDCLSKDDIKNLFDLGDYKDNEMLVYKNDDKDDPIEVWKIKVKEGQDATFLMRKLTVRRSLCAEEFEDNPDLKKILESSEGSALNSVGDVITLILSNHLQEVNEQTNEWLRE